MSQSNKIESAKKLKKIATDYYQNLDKASKNPHKKVAWCSSVGPAELLLAFDFNVYYPENHTAILGASRSANKYIPVAVAQGYSPEICSYLTSDIGAYIKGETGLKRAYGLETVPKPDILIFNTNQCRDVQDWFNYYAREFKVPILGVNSPTSIDELSSTHIKAVEEQLKSIAEKLEEFTNQSFEQKKLEEKLQLSLECSNKWNSVLETAKNIPSPFTFFDGCIHMLPAVVLRGTEVAIEYYEILEIELKSRIENGIEAVSDEKFRCFWEGMPIWGKLRALSTQFSELKTSVVASTYCSSWIFTDFNPQDPFRSMAKAYTELFINRSDSSKEKYLKEMINNYNIDGIIYHNARTCPNNSNTNYGMPKRLEHESGIPSLQIDADLNDLNVYSEEQTKTNIEAFVEQLAGI
jgi:benzoyl-CoA reductase/2-hydroxyglutaryl-CoA dehydratase subunit BcrC/BadD/HgdB